MDKKYSEIQKKIYLKHKSHKPNDPLNWLLEKISIMIAEAIEMADKQRENDEK